jgi:threonine dehydrogenase-like Zn-dependent dehydrogenase
MSKTMKAFVMHGIGEVGVVDKPIPQPGPDDALVRTTTALVCTSDTHTVGGALGERSDLILGHEAVGVVAEVGSNVHGFEEGQRVAVSAITPCFRCASCQRGYTSQCGGMLGGWKFANEHNGTFADYFLVNAADGNLAEIPSELTDEQAVYCADMLSTGFAAAENAAIPLGGTVAVFSQGPVGLMATVGARLLGAGKVIAVETIDNRKELSRFYGADSVVDFQETDPVEAIFDETDGRGVDAAIEALGAAETFAACVKATKAGGTISNVGYHGDGDTVPIPRMEWGVGMSDKTIRTALCPGGAVRMERLMQLVRAGRVDPTRMTTHRFHFDDIEKAFSLMQTKDEDIIKPVVELG